MISVIAKLPIKEGKVEEAIAAVKELMVQVAQVRRHFTVHPEQGSIQSQHPCDHGALQRQGRL